VRGDFFARKISETLGGGVSSEILAFDNGSHELVSLHCAASLASSSPNLSSVVCRFATPPVQRLHQFNQLVPHGARIGNLALQCQDTRFHRLHFPGNYVQAVHETAEHALFQSSRSCGEPLKIATFGGSQFNVYLIIDLATFSIFFFLLSL